MNPDTPRIEVTVAAPVDVVWNALRDREKIRHWHGWDYEGLEQEIDLIFYTEHTEDARARTLELHGGDRFELQPDGDGTRITLTRSAPGGDPEWDAYYDDITQGWITFLHQLKFLLERRPDAPRRTRCSSPRSRRDRSSTISACAMSPGNRPAHRSPRTSPVRTSRARCGSAPTTSSESRSTRGARPAC